MHVHFQIPNVAIFGNETQITLSVASGSDITFEIDYGFELETVNEVPFDNHVTTHHRFNATGYRTVTAYARNGVSALLTIY